MNPSSWILSNCKLTICKNVRTEVEVQNQTPALLNIGAQGLSLDLSLGPSVLGSLEVQPQEHGEWSHHQETDDNGIAIISSREYLQARSNRERRCSAGNHPSPSEEAHRCATCKGRRQDDSRFQLKSETSHQENKVSDLPVSAKPVAVPEEPLFSCPICLSNLIEPTATKCGHIFCKECLINSLKKFKNKCPTCRQKIGKRCIFRVYLPTTE